MDIRNWPMDRIMQLPDCVFGRRFNLCVCPDVADGGHAFDISETACPERIVIWEFHLWVGVVFVHVLNWGLAWGQQLPANFAEFNLLEPVFPGMGFQGAPPRRNPTPQQGNISVTRLKMPVHTAGRRLVGRVQITPVQAGNLVVFLVVSSIPTEVPDWLISGPARSL